MAGLRQTWLPAEPASAGVARSFIRKVAVELALEQRETDDLILATSEAVANAIEHGRPCGELGVRISVQGALDRVLVEIRDCGMFSAALPTSAPSLPAPGSLRGRGLPIIQALADELELIADGGATVVRFSKRRHS